MVEFSSMSNSAILENPFSPSSITYKFLVAINDKELSLFYAREID